MLLPGRPTFVIREELVEDRWHVIYCTRHPVELRASKEQAANVRLTESTRH